MADFTKRAAAAKNSAVLRLLDEAGVQLMQEDGKTPVTITLTGKDSDAFIAAENDVTNRRIEGQAKVTAERLRADTIEALARCTVAWDGIGVGEDVSDCTFDNAVALYTQVPFIREQVDAFVGKRANFLKASPAA